MTDKLIIDGVDVSKFTINEIEYKLRHTTKNNIIEDYLNLNKQFQRKQQECKELKHNKKVQENIINNLNKEIDDLYKENDRYKQALEKIEDYCTKTLTEHFNHCKYAKGCVNACGIDREVILSSILNIINEVKE